MDEHSLRLLEFRRVTSAVAMRAGCAEARARLSAWNPVPDAAERGTEIELLDQAIRREREPGGWLEVEEEPLMPRLAEDHPERLDGPGLVHVIGWLRAAAETRDSWSEAAAARFPALAARIAELPALEPLRERLDQALEPDGRVRDQASPALERARRAVEAGERELQRKLERWAGAFGEDSYVTRHGDRFVALVPAAGFPRRRAIVHDVSGSGHSLFVEPIEMCEMNNRVLELAASAAEMERRILAELAECVRGEAVGLERIESVLLHLDTLRARARWGVEVGATAVVPGGDVLRLVGARHPLLVMGERPEAVVPLDLELRRGESLLLVSGPNMGGKTVLLKTVGLSVTLAHAAFPVPAREGTRLPEVEHVEVALGDEQSLDQGLSTFAAHLRTLAVMARRAGPRTLLLCDEIGGGTDPEEGAALGRAAIEHFAARGAWGVITTHLGSLKRLAIEVQGVLNGSLEFDTDSMTPRYRFVPGVPGASHALSMAERLGLAAELCTRARELVGEEAVALERLLVELQSARRSMDEERGLLADARAAAERAAEDGRAAAEQVRQSLEGLRRRLTHESEVLLSHARELWQTVQREARRAEKTRAGATEMRERIEAVEREVESVAKNGEAAAAELGGGGRPPGPALVPLVPGARVRLKDLGLEAEVVDGPDPEGKVTLRRGSWSIQSHVSRLAPADPQPPHDSANRSRTGRTESGRGPLSGPIATWEGLDEAPPLEVDLRGMEVEEALRSLDLGLDRGVLSGLSELRIVHGVGRGILRAAVEKHLRGHPQVAAVRLGRVGEGGRGVTVATLR